MAVLCVCSTLNDINDSFCIECGANIKKENSQIVCVCGHKNPISAKFCQDCQRPLNPKRLIISKIICSCGEVNDWDTEFCPNCGKNIKKMFLMKNFLRNTVKSLKNRFR